MQKNYCPSYLEVLEFAPLHPDLIVVFGGRNQSDFPVADVAADVDRFFARAKERFPDTRIVATTPLWDLKEAPQSMKEMDAAVRAAADTHGAEYLDLGQPLFDNPEALVPNDLHPNNKGHALIADTFVANFRP